MFFIQYYVEEWNEGVRKTSEFRIYRTALHEIKEYIKELQKSDPELIECVQLVMKQIKDYRFCSKNTLETLYHKDTINQLFIDLGVTPFYLNFQ